MAANQQVISIIEKAVGSGGKRQGHQGDYGFQCPFCGHRKKKLWVKLDPDSEKYQNWRCWVCDESGKSLFTLLKKTDAPKSLFKRLEKYVDSPGGRYREEEEDEEEDFRITLPDDYRPLWEDQSDIVFRHAVNRLKKRGLSYGDVVKHEIGYCKRGDYEKRLIIPSFDASGQLNYFVGRAIWSDQFPKYKNPSAPRNSIIPFESLINWRETVTIVEGPFDAISIRRNAIPLLGNNMPEKLITRLIEAPTEEINVALDADMKETAIEIAEDFLSEGFTVRLIELSEGSDPDDLGFEKMAERIKSTEPLDYGDLVSQKLWT